MTKSDEKTNEKGEKITPAPGDRETRANAKPADYLVNKIWALTATDTPELISQTCNEVLASAVKYHWSSLKNRPRSCFSIGKTGFVMDFCTCRNPKVLHIHPEGLCDLKEQISQDLQFELEMQLNEIHSVKLLFNAVSDIDSPRDRTKSMRAAQTPQGQNYEPKRTSLPKFSINSLESWIKKCGRLE